MNTIEGQIEIDWYAGKDDGQSVHILSSRPVQASKIMIGKSPNQVLSILPLMFSVCGVAQARASLSAIMQQLQRPLSPAEESARNLLVIAETAREHVFRILMDWPDLFDSSNDKKRYQQNFPFITGFLKNLGTLLFKDGQAFTLNSQLQPDLPQLEKLISELEILLTEEIFLQPLQDWLAIDDLQGLQNWSQQTDSIAALSVSSILNNDWADQGQSPSDFLPMLDEQLLLDRFNQNNAADFIAQPDWKNRQYETTTLNRQHKHPLINALLHRHGNGLMTRWMARLVELAQIPSRLRELLINVNAPSNEGQIQSSIGISQVEAARGKLIHRVAIEQDQITQYQILAPTEWNFHPQGLIRDSLSNIKTTDKDQIKSIARLMINAIDPCVGYDLRIHA